jgi:hypothetical protein
MSETETSHAEAERIREAMKDAVRVHLLRKALQEIYDEAVDGRLSLTKGQLIAGIAANALEATERPD